MSDSKPKLSGHDSVIDEAFALAALPKRSFGAHKWSVGGVVLIAGGPNYIGAAALAAMAAGRAGAGIVNVAVSRGAMGAVAAIVPEAAFLPLPEGELDSVARRAREVIAGKLERSAAAVVGPGLGEDEYVDALLGAIFGRRDERRSTGLGFRKREFAETLAGESTGAILGGDKPTVVDADGLNWLAKQSDWWTSMTPGSLVLTPHVGEMERLTGETAEAILADPAGVAKASAAKWNQIVVLKHGHTVVSDGKTTVAAAEAPLSLATAGSGDVLAGTIGALLAQGVAPLQAAALAVFLGTSAARSLESRFGVLGVVASDLPTAIAETIGTLERKRDA